MTYQMEFNQAIELSRDIGFNVPSIPYTSQRYLSDAIQDELHAYLLRTLGPPPNLHNLIGQCLINHLVAADVVAQIVGVSPVFTVGYMTTGEDDCYHFSDRDLRRWISSGALDSTKFVGHAWLTLPSMEVIDFTHLATFGYVNRHLTNNEIQFGVISRHADEIQGFSYRPVAVGDDIPIKIGAFHSALALNY